MQQITNATPRSEVRARAFPIPRKALGQHFLVDGSILRRIVEAGDLRSGDAVVEIGSGRGALTRELVKGVQRVIAVELDAALASSLGGSLGDPSNLTVVCADAREYDLSELLPAGLPYKLMANLPYYAANPIIRRFLEAESPPSLMVVMVQQEVARAMAAAPGRMSLLSVAVQFYGQPQLVCSVPPRAFQPRPKVSSAVVRIDLRPQPAVATKDATGFFELVRAGFRAPRKQLHNSLGLGLGVPPSEASRVLGIAGVDSTRRPGSLALEEWGRLYHAWRGA